MKIIKSIFAVFAIAALTVTAQAAEKKVNCDARVDIQAPKGVKLELFKKDLNPGSYINHQTWIKDEVMKVANAYFQTTKLKEGQWNEMKFAFTTDKDAKVKLSFRGKWSRNNELKKYNNVWVYYDMITVEGSTIKNGGFEEKDAEGKPAGWSMKDKKLYITGGEIKAADGESYVHTTFSRPVVQTIEVKAGQKVTVTMKIFPSKVDLASAAK